MSCGNYHISVQQALNSFVFKRLEIFNALTLEKSSSHHDDCCTERITERVAITNGKGPFYIAS